MRREGRDKKKDFAPPLSVYTFSLKETLGGLFFSKVLIERLSGALQLRPLQGISGFTAQSVGLLATVVAAGFTQAKDENWQQFLLFALTLKGGKPNRAA